ncbi:MAG TPA: carboxypeptidase-like regulatory domain-containing protein [Gemmatimonadaceae bacterium]|nr:carboxypeptidase-like regulatory domain-containing protein [Gemmatimonadaceae bacterium]
MPTVRTVRVPWLLALASLVAACSGDPASPPTSPTSNAPTPPLTPTPNPSAPTPAPGSFTITGVVQEGERAVPGIYANAWVQETGGFGYSWWWAHGPLHADSAGRFVISHLPMAARVWLQAFDVAHDQPCAVSIAAIRGDTTVNITVVSTAAATPTAQSSAGSRSVSGTVVTSGGQPAVGAWIDFEPIMDFPAATTHTDAAGRFALCGLPVDEAVWLGAVLGSSVGYLAVPVGQTEGLKIVLP